MATPGTPEWELNIKINKVLGYYSGFGANPAIVSAFVSLIADECEKVRTEAFNDALGDE